MDTRIPHGDNWDLVLSDALKTNKTLIAVLTPLYVGRPNCGKELMVFVLRSNPGVGIDSNGSLTGVKNVILIRWLPEGAYSRNGQKDFLLPPILRLIEDTPEEKPRDSARNFAIKRYRQKGMERCVKPGAGYYRELLDAIVERIINMDELDQAKFEVSFAKVDDAFSLDWRSFFALRGVAATPVPTLPTNQRIAPQPLSSLAVFYVTHRPLLRDHEPVAFADWLVTEPVGEIPGVTDPFADLLADIREAAVAERLDIFHCSGDFDTAEPITARLARLGETRVLTALVVDPAVWPGSMQNSEASAVEQIVRSDRWTGPVLLPTLDPNAQEIDADFLAANRELPSRLVTLPGSRVMRATILRLIFANARGLVFRTSTDNPSGAERLPRISGPTRESA